MTPTVLIVDAHAGFRSFARTFLEAAGMNVIGEAADGCAAVDAADRLRPDVVLLDVLLPDGDGFEVAKRILEGAHRAAVVLTSTRDAADFGRRVQSCGARGFIGKGDLSRQRLEALLWDDGIFSR